MSLDAYVITLMEFLVNEPSKTADFSDFDFNFDCFFPGFADILPIVMHRKQNKIT